MTKKKIPYGISNFETIEDNNYYFVDKTKYVEILESLNERFIFFLRPRKFGKSLFVSLLEYYYGIEHKDKFDKLFGEYYIGKNPTPKANSYYILRFDFSSIMTSTNEETFRGFRKKVIDGVKYFNNSYSLFTKEELTEILEEKSSNEILTSFFNAFTSNDDAKIYILIDEYDHFTNELISFRRDEFRDIVSRNGYVRKFYEAIKEGTGKGIVDRFFATGVTPVTLDSLTSGFNIGSDLTLDTSLNEMLGFTDEEVKDMLEYYEINNSEEMMSDLHRLYNGSLFSIDATERIYNSNMLLYFLNQYLKANQYPKDLIDNNIAIDYSKIKKIFYINNSPENQQKLNEIITNEETTAAITEKYSFEREFTPDDFVSLLFYNGMLTIKNDDFPIINFKIPNYVIKEIYWSFFASELSKKLDVSFSVISLQQSIKELALNGNMDIWVGEIERILELLSNRDYQNFDEKYIKMLFISLASFTPMFLIKSKTEVEGEYPDLMYLHRKPNKFKYQFLIELKYLKKSESKKLLTTIEIAKTQVTRYLQKPEIKELENLKSYAVVFLGKKAHFELVSCG